ncbi:MAG: hypothetical protein MZW92_69590 [Comamonadaceae bacterium]|nr:hypothetical protein [Comamonadaceae bacterium]
MRWKAGNGGGGHAPRGAASRSSIGKGCRRVGAAALTPAGRCLLASAWVPAVRDAAAARRRASAPRGAAPQGGRKGPARYGVPACADAQAPGRDVTSTRTLRPSQEPDGPRAIRAADRFAAAAAAARPAIDVPHRPSRPATWSSA